VVSGPQSSGKTSATALITKHLEESKEDDRVRVGHCFFPMSTRKSDDDKNPVPAALKYVAFQIARVDTTVRRALGKACDAGPAAFKRTENLDTLWRELKTGASASGATYYLVLNGVEHLPEEQAERLLSFAFGPKLASESGGRICFLLSGTDDLFTGGRFALDGTFCIRMQDHNSHDMRLIVHNALARQGILQHTRPGSNQQRAWDKIIDKLPENVKGSYSRLQFALDDVIRLLSTRSAMPDLNRLLDQSTSSYEAAMKQP
jgi:hypothetical protein